ncbi:hypothetical protein [Granulicella arctica]|uniref:hypothetical protein n=1 Tax=Granulicella arctica TaxID=940613 RepID=UPI0021E03E94|nr:hypothetical protein [Granulicella arctica]
MPLPRLLVLIALGLFVPCISAQTSKPAANVAPKVVFSSGTNAYTITVTDLASGPALAGIGLSTSLLVTVSPVGAYNTPVKLTCADLPVEASCTFAIDTIPGGGGNTALAFTTAAPHDCGSTTPYFYGNSASLNYIGPVLAGLLLLWLPRRRIWLRGLLGLIAISTTIGLAGCGHCTDLGTKPGTYTFQLNGTAVGTQALALGDLVTVPVTVQVQY